jgi:hypothetical protein
VELPSDADKEGTMYWQSSSGGTSPGTMTVRSLGTTELRRRGFTAPVTRFDRYDYGSPADIAGSLAEFDRYSAEVYTGTDGVRRFLPRQEEGVEGFIARAFQIGHSLLCREHRWDKPTFDDYCVGKLSFDWARHARERLKPRQLSAEELVVPGRLRRDLLRSDALPDELAEGSDVPRGSAFVNRITTAGIAAAAARGSKRPSETELIALGLMDAAAERPPLVADAAQMAGLVRGALFDFADDVETVSPAAWGEIAAEFEVAVRSRLDISRQQFNDWLYGKRAYMLQTVEKAVTPDDDDPRSLVRRAMLEQAWRGFGQVNECLDAFARTFERAILRPLNERERRLYGVMYRRQPYFGGFVLPLLLDAGDLLKYAVLDLWEEPDGASKIEVVKRMFLYRGEILPRVREMQRRARAAGGALVESSTDEPAPLAPCSEWDELTGHILELRGIECPDCDAQLVCTAAKTQRTRSAVVVDVGCPEHGPRQRLTITHAELSAAREALRGREA